MFKLSLEQDVLKSKDLDPWQVWYNNINKPQDFDTRRYNLFANYIK